MHSSPAGWPTNAKVIQGLRGRTRSQQWSSPPTLSNSIQTVYLVSSCHLDVGFKDSARNIVNSYLDTFFPDAIATAHELRRNSSFLGERLVFMTYSYLVSLYLSCPPHMGLHCVSSSAFGLAARTAARCQKLRRVRVSALVLGLMTTD